LAVSSCSKPVSGELSWRAAVRSAHEATIQIIENDQVLQRRKSNKILN